MDSSAYSEDSVLVDFIGKPMYSLSPSIKRHSSRTSFSSTKVLAPPTKSCVLPREKPLQKPRYNPEAINKVIRQKIEQVSRLNINYKKGLDKAISEIIEGRGKYRANKSILAPKLSRVTMKKKLSPLEAKTHEQRQSPAERKKKLFIEALAAGSPLIFGRNSPLF